MGPKRLAAILRDMANKIDNSAQPSRSLIARDLTRLMASLRVADGQEQAPEQVPAPEIAAAPAGDQQAIEQAIYGHTADSDPNKGTGSSIWWKVFADMGMADWTPMTDYAAVEKRAWELLNEWQPWEGMPEQQKYFQKTIDGLKENWNDYQQHYMPEHVKILKEKGLM